MLQSLTPHIRGALLFTIAIVAAACKTGDLGVPCIPEEEYLTDFSGFSEGEVTTESRSYQCESRLCLVNHFRGRATCPYGQKADGSGNCTVPDSGVRISVAVEPQLQNRRAAEAVYCSCRCNGPDSNARYCECPSGFACEELVPEVGSTNKQLVGSYCVMEGTSYVPGQAGSSCDATLNNCPD